MAIKFNSAYAKQFIRENDVKGLEAQVAAAHGLVNDKTGLGNDFLGWVDLPVNYDKEEFARIKAAAAKIRRDTDILIVIGTALACRLLYDTLNVIVRNVVCLSLCDNILEL